MAEEEAARADVARNKSLQDLFVAMSNKNNRVQCPDTGVNLFQGLNLIDDDQNSLTLKAQAAMAAANSAKRKHEDPDSDGESDKGKKLKSGQI